MATTPREVHRLHLAVLLDGLSRALGANPERVPEWERRGQQWEAWAWVCAEGTDGPFTFDVTCRLLSLAPSAVRTALRHGVITLDGLANASDGLLSPPRRLHLVPTNRKVGQ